MISVGTTIQQNGQQQARDLGDCKDPSGHRLIQEAVNHQRICRCSDKWQVPLASVSAIGSLGFRTAGQSSVERRMLDCTGTRQ